MQYQVLLEFDADSGHYTGTVPGLPNIVVDAASEEEALTLAREAIAFHLEEARSDAHAEATPAHPSSIRAQLVTVDV